MKVEHKINIHQPKVAIIIPVYNDINELNNLLDQLYKIDYQQFDIITIDNGSDEPIDDIKKLFPNIYLFRNDKNLGIGGGFNTGIKHAISMHDYEYLWLLDSDLQIDKSCLTVLVKLMEDNRDIAISSPKILNTLDNKLIVTMGAIIQLDKGQKYDLYSNAPDISCSKTFNVDHVGAGNCLIRTSIIKNNILFDERYFLQWEDADFGLTVKKMGYKIVTTTDAVVYHPPFTEKRPATLMAYYTYRNILLTVSKHSNTLSRITGLYNVLRRLFKECVFRATNNKNLSKLNLFAVIHFLSNKWGQPLSIKEYFNVENLNKPKNSYEWKNDFNKILIITSFANYKDIEHLVQKLQSSSSNMDISILTQLDRVQLYSNLYDVKIISYDHISKFFLWEYLKTFVKLMVKQYDLAINSAPESGSVFTYSSKKVVDWNKNQDTFMNSSENMYSIWKIPAALILGEIIAIVVFPLIYISSFRYRYTPSIK